MRRSYVFAFAALAWAGCASAGKEGLNNHGDDPDAGGIQHPDGQSIDPPDATPIPDAPPGITQLTLAQTADSTLTPGNSVACPADTVGTGPNIYYRVFDLAAAGINSEFTVNTVSFQVEDCESVNADGASVAVRVGTYSGAIGSTLDQSKITILQSNNSVQIPEVDEVTGPPASTPGSLVNAPITATIPGGSQLVVEVDAPDGNNQYQFYIASNASDQNQASGGLSYVSSSRCTPNPGLRPTDADTLAPTPMHILLTVTGTFQ